jgi:drug/metabolite transporter (DMT)-like permease
MLLASAMAFIISYKTFFTFVPNKKILVAGLFLGAHFALFFRSVQLTSIAEAALLGTISPVFTEIYSILFQRKPFSSKVSLGLLLALFGALILISQSSFSATSSLGNILAVLCSIAMAAVLLIGKEGEEECWLIRVFSLDLFLCFCLFVFHCTCSGCVCFRISVRRLCLVSFSCCRSYNGWPQHFLLLS